ncbi:hypothetical protein L9F63_019836, partial [Diploptera punctata]
LMAFSSSIEFLVSMLLFLFSLLLSRVSVSLELVGSMPRLDYHDLDIHNNFHPIIKKYRYQYR